MFGSGKIQMLQSQLRDAEDRLDKVTREKDSLAQQLSAANAKIAQLESQLEDFDLEQLKEQAKASHAEYEGLKELYARKVKEFDDTKEEKEQAFARESALSRHNLENEIRDNREANRAYVSGTVRQFSESYNYYLNQIKLMMDALGDVAARTGEKLFSGIDESQNLMLSIGQEMSEKLNAETDGLRDEEKGLVLIANAEAVDSQLPQEVEVIPAEEEELAGEESSEPVGEAAEAEEVIEEAAADADGEAAETVEEAVDLAEAAEEAAADAAECACEEADELAEAADAAAADAIECACEEAGELAETAGEAVSDAVEEAAEGAETFAEDALDAAKEGF